MMQDVIAGAQTSLGLNDQDMIALAAPLPLEDHEAREKGTSKDGTKKQYLVYITQEGVLPRLNSIDPNWSWEIQREDKEERYVSMIGRLTVKGVAREGCGGSSPNGENAPVDEDTVKGAETDALKRAALRFGVGLYLRSAPSFWIDAKLTPWDRASAALEQFAVWYRKTYGGVQNPTQPTASPESTGLTVVQRPGGSHGASPSRAETPNILHADVFGISWHDKKDKKGTYYRLIGFDQHDSEIEIVAFDTKAIELLGFDLKRITQKNKRHVGFNITGVPYTPEEKDGVIFKALDVETVLLSDQYTAEPT